MTVNGFLQSVSNPAVYAGGDAAASGPPLTPKADHDVAVLATNLIEPYRRQPPTPDYSGLAAVVLSAPPLASVGLAGAAARAAGQEPLGLGRRHAGIPRASSGAVRDEKTDEREVDTLTGRRLERALTLLGCCLMLLPLYVLVFGNLVILLIEAFSLAIP